ncbi:M48 family metalloprotease [Arenimonas caeni]|jgi:predicted Zn-dependent protease|uniref:M48 family metalloprotease n=1 Tax=Arenimonas caeni TaxID=2058085 RepID=UPI002A35A07E|nr:M48 family metalloprotease [Arenimonas caeni]MDY0020921.1 M48 family metalloprotease [Arenimonas caeni]
MKTRHVLAALVALALASPAAGFGRFGDSAEKLLNFGKRAADASAEITTEDEIELGRGIAAQLLGARPLVRNQALQTYVNRVGLWLALQTERPDLPWRFGVMDSTDVNAFALPGGTVLITQGLYDRLADEAELAAVLAHEISHVVERHQVNAIKKEMGKDFANELAGETVARSDNEVVRRFGNRAFGVGTELFARGLDKNDEYQADAHGMVIAARGGYNPYALVSVLHTLDGAAPDDAGVALMFSTHPNPVTRIDYLDKVIGDRLEAYADVEAPERMVR